MCHCLVFSPYVSLAAFTGLPAHVSSLYSSPLLPVGRLLLLVPPVPPLARGTAGLLTTGAPGTLRFLLVLLRHSRVLLPPGALPRAKGVVVVSLPLGPSLPAHIFQGSAVAFLGLSRALRALDMISPALGGSFGTCRLVFAGHAGVTLSRESLGVRASGTLVVEVRVILSSGSVGLASMLIVVLPSARGPNGSGVPPEGFFGGGSFR